jgi:excisionase family DNA binding protein
METETFLRHFYTKELRDYIHQQARRHFRNVEDQADATQEAWCMVGMCKDDIDDEACRRKVYAKILQLYRARRRERKRIAGFYRDDIGNHSIAFAYQGGERVKLWTVMEAATLMRISRKTLTRYCNRQEIPHIRIGSRILFKEDDLYRWIEEHAIISQGYKGIEMDINNPKRIEKS